MPQQTIWIFEYLNGAGSRQGWKGIYTTHGIQAYNPNVVTIHVSFLRTTLIPSDQLASYIETCRQTHFRISPSTKMAAYGAGYW